MLGIRGYTSEELSQAYEHHNKAKPRVSKMI